MLIERATKYRIYPTAEQLETLDFFEWRLRVLYNLVLEHRFMYLGRRKSRYNDELVLRNAYRMYDLPMDEKKFGWGEFVGNATRGMSKMLTELRQEEFFKGIPRAAMILVVQASNFAFDNMLSKRARKPRFKRRGDSMIIGDFGSGWSVSEGEVRLFPRSLGVLKAVTHRLPPSNTVKMRRCVISRTADQWHAAVSYQMEIPDPVQRDIPVVGIDRGVAYLLADSTGRMVSRPGELDRVEKRIRFALRRLAKKSRGSSNRRKARIWLSRLKARKSWVLKDLLHKEAHYYAEKYGIVVLEDLKVKNMTASAKGTAEEPGTNVKAKSGLNRVILESGWGIFKSLLEYKLKERGGTLIVVPPQYSSQTCSMCGHVSADNRRSRDEFRCEMCGYEDHADINAAKVLVSRRPGGEAACGGLPIRGPMKQESPVVRQGTHTHFSVAQRTGHLG